MTRLIHLLDFQTTILMCVFKLFIRYFQFHTIRNRNCLHHITLSWCFPPVDSTREIHIQSLSLLPEQKTPLSSLLCSRACWINEMPESAGKHGDLDTWVPFTVEAHFSVQSIPVKEPIQLLKALVKHPVQQISLLF